MGFRILPILLAGTLLCSAASATFPPGLDRYTGDWVLVPEASDNVEQAIEKTIAPMSFVTRPIARTRLRARNVAFPRMTITVNQDGLRVRHEKGMNVLYKAPDALLQVVTPDGSDAATQVLFDPDPHLRYEAESGKREDRYTLAADGSRLVLTVQVTSPKLPGPLTYKLVYSRQGH